MTHRTERALAAIFTSLAVLAGCSPASPIDPPSATEGAGCIQADSPSLDPGQSAIVVPGVTNEEGVFIAISDGSMLSPVFGPQGGFHLDLAAQIYVEPSAATIVEVMVSGREDESVRIVAEACEGWSEVFTRLFDPPGEATLSFRLLDRNREEVTAEEVDVVLR